jgi:hypothetical protein
VPLDTNLPLQIADDAEEVADRVFISSLKSVPLLVRRSPRYSNKLRISVSVTISVMGSLDEASKPNAK